MMHQSAPGGPDLSSPYMLWQYVQFMTPPKSSEYTVHQAFTQPVPPYPPQHLGYVPQQYVTNYNYRIQEQPRPVYPSHTGAPDAQRTSSDIMCKKSNQYMKRAGRFRSDRSANISLNQLRSSQSSAATRNSTNFSSPAKGSTFTIDAILNKADKSRSPMDISPQSEPHSHKIHEATDSCCTTPFRSEPVSPTRIQPCSPTTARFVQPLMHSTPAHERGGGPERRNNRLYELNHPYMFHPYDNTHLPHHTHGVPHHTHGVPHTPMTSSLSSLSSLSSGSSSLSMSPESSSTQLKDKTERKSGGKPKRIRTIFTPEQLEKLEAEFERQQYMVGTERYYLAATLNLTEAQVKVWFQNRRIKWRKQHLEQQQARLAQGDLYKDVDEESDDTDNEERAGNEEAENESKIKSDISDEMSYAMSS